MKVSSNYRYARDITNLVVWLEYVNWLKGIS